MIVCPRCNGDGRLEYNPPWQHLDKDCKNCDGTGKVPHSNAWRPFEPSVETHEAAQEALTENTCNRHNDCAAAVASFIERRGHAPGFGFHCHDDDCEDCFGC